MTSDTAPQIVRLDAIGDIVAAVPHLLGFGPADSLVAVALTGPRQRMTFSMRVDLPTAGHEHPVAQAVAAGMRRAGARAVMLFLYAEAPATGDPLPQRALVDAVAAMAPVEVRDAVLVAGDRIWSYFCDDPHCCPPEGRRLDPQAPGALAVAAAHALNGGVVLPDRDSVLALVRPVAGPAAAAMEQAVERAAAAYAHHGDAAFRRSAQTRLVQLLTAYAHPPFQLSDDDAAQLVVAMHNVRFRDEVLRCCVEQPDGARLLLHDVVRRALPPLDGPACTLFAFVAYLAGDGVLAAAAIDRALASDPGYPLARLLSAALARQLPPARLREIALPPTRQRRSSARRR